MSEENTFQMKMDLYIDLYLRHLTRFRSLKVFPDVNPYSLNEPWYLYHMVTQNILRTNKEKWFS